MPYFHRIPSCEMNRLAVSEPVQDGSGDAKLSSAHERVRIESSQFLRPFPYTHLMPFVIFFCWVKSTLLVA